MDLDKRTDELLADAAIAQGGFCTAAQHYRDGEYRNKLSWLVVRSLIEPPTDAKLREILSDWNNRETNEIESLLDLLRFAFDQRTPTPEPTIAEIAATLRAAGHEAMAVKVEGKSNGS